MSTAKNLAELKQLRDVATRNIFRRIQLAEDVLSDLKWIAATHQGDDGAAQDAIQSEFFPDLGGFINLGRLREVLRAFPTEATWKEYRYDLRAMVELLHQQENEEGIEERANRTSYKKLAGELEQRAKTAERAASTSQEALVTAQQRISDLETEVARCHGRIEELTRLIDRRHAA